MFGGAHALSVSRIMGGFYPLVPRGHLCVLRGPAHFSSPRILGLFSVLFSEHLSLSAPSPLSFVVGRLIMFSAFNSV